MLTLSRRPVVAALLVGIALAAVGCGSTEKATVEIQYALNPSKGLPPGMETVAILDAKVDEVADEEWSELAAAYIQDLIQDSNDRYGTNLRLADRKHTSTVMKESDLAAAGLTASPNPGKLAQLLNVQGMIMAEIKVKVEKHSGKGTTISSLWGGGGGGRYWGYGHGGASSREVEKCRALEMEVIQVSHGIHAWKILQKQSVNLIIAGWVLPEISGVGLLNLVRGNPETEEVPMVLVSGKLRKEQVLEAARAGVSDILIMPMAGEELRDKLARVLKAEDDPRRRQAERLFQQGRDLMRQERFGEALRIFEAVLTVYEAAEVFYNLGFIKTAQEDYHQAIFYFRRATQINKAFAQAYGKMAQCYEKLGELHQAQACYQKAAVLFMEKDMDDEAEEMLNQVVRFSPETINVYNTLGIIYRKRGDYESAAAQYRKAIKVNPKDENIFYNLARTYFEAGELFLAGEVLREALLMSPQFGHAKDLLRVVERKLEQEPS